MGKWNKTKDVGIYRDDTDGWLIRASIKVNGETREKKKTLRGPKVTRTRALETYARLKEELQGLEPVAKEPRGTIVVDFAEQWLERSVKREIRRPRVIEVYTQILADHVMPYLGHLAPRDITRRCLENMVDAWTEKRKPNGQRYARATVLNWWKVARELVRDLCATYRITPDPTKRIRIPKKFAGPRREQGTLTAEQLQQLLDFTEQFTPQRYAEVSFLALGGFRPSEIYALLWEHHIDWDNREVLVERSVDRGHVDLPKTASRNHDNVDASRRVVVPQRAINALEAHRDWLIETRHTGLSSGLVFPSNAGTHRTPASLSKTLKKARDHLGFDIRLTPQVLRRTYNTLLREVSDAVTRHALMGHSDERINERYTHVSYEKKAAVVEEFSRLVGV